MSSPHQMPVSVSSTSETSSYASEASPRHRVEKDEEANVIENIPGTCVIWSNRTHEPSSQFLNNPAFTRDDLKSLHRSAFEYNKTVLGLNEEKAREWADEEISSIEETELEFQAR